jgi:GH15 family glucan-1,4-alpha-glucosidase
MYRKISDYGIVGNLYTVALVGLDGSVDWLCLPHIDSPSVFGALLDDKKGGRFSVAPASEWDSAAGYVPDTNVLVTRFRTRTGVLHVTDFMPVSIGGSAGPDAGDVESHELYRLIEVKEGAVGVSVLFEPRFDYARAETSLEGREFGVLATGEGESLALSSTRSIEVAGGGAAAVWKLREGERVWLHLVYGKGEPRELRPEDAERALGDTKEFWESWLRKSETGRTLDLGPYQGMVNRSALVLKLLYYNPTGAIAAAATTSLPEEVGGERNWDYRYTWVRDTSFTLQALFSLGHLQETEGYLRWVEKLLSEHGVEGMQIMYGLRGEEDLPEEELPHLDGYKGSRPVRIGNGAARQRQLDIYGELMEAALKLSDYVGKIDAGLWPFLRSVCDYVLGCWRDRDSGIWEVRGGPFHFVYSKVMCWVALDRGMTIARRYGFPADLGKWEKAAREIREEVLNRGWSGEKGAFRQHYGTDALDSSNLLIPMLGFLPFDDPKVVSNLEATVRELGEDGFLYRYRAKDGLRGGEGAFLLCTFWLIDSLVAMGRLGEAEELIRKVKGKANHLGLFSEEYDLGWDEPLGNFPQAFTHIGHINSITALCREKQMAAREKAGAPSGGLLLSSEIVLNDGEAALVVPPGEMAARLKNAMNVLRGAFFDTKRGRVAYEGMGGSDAYGEYERLSYALKNMDLGELGDRKEKLAFWINLYNVIVIHGVVALGVRDSVKEVRNFFRRVKYRIGDMHFSPDDIEHGILRGNRRPPNAFLKPFRGGDGRLGQTVKPMDPRIHFALVCASSSCPPIGVYTPEKIDDELDIAAMTFLNAGGLVPDRERGRVSLSRVFQWYGGDFGKTQGERLRFLAPYLYDDSDREYVVKNADALKATFQDYDWRLNRY